MASWAVYILPYLEQKALYDLWNLEAYPGSPYAIGFGQQLSEAVQTPVAAYFCPSRRSPHDAPTLSLLNQDNGDGEVGQQGALGDYACNIGTTGDDIWNGNLATALPNGPFHIGEDGDGANQRAVSLKEILEGLSSTIMLGEKHVPLKVPGHPPTNSGFGNKPWDCSIYDGMNYQCSARSGGVSYPIANSINDFGWKFGSDHAGYCQFVFCDGSVHAIHVGISGTMLDNLCNIADGNVVVPDY